MVGWVPVTFGAKVTGTFWVKVTGTQRRNRRIVETEGGSDDFLPENGKNVLISV